MGQSLPNYGGEQSTVSLQRALDETRTGDIWLFRGAPGRTGRSVDDQQPGESRRDDGGDRRPPAVIWHAELGDKLTDMWTGTNHRGVQLNDARQAVERWMPGYDQRCWLRQLTPYATREQEDRVLRVIARMDGTAFPTTARLTGRWIAAGFRARRLDPRNPVRAQQGPRETPAQEGREASKPGCKRRTAPRRSPSPTRRWGC